MKPSANICASWCRYVYFWLTLIVAATAPYSVAAMVPPDTQYPQALLLYQQRNLLSLEKLAKEMRSNGDFFAENATLLKARLQFERGLNRQALESFKTLLGSAVRGSHGGSTSKTPTNAGNARLRRQALWNISAILDKQGSFTQASRGYQMIIKEFPGSKESQRAWLQLRLKREKVGS